MPGDLGYLAVPLLGCLVLVGIHAWLGIHVLSRGVIFVDLAMAQIAALGATLALYKGLDPGTTGSYVFALAFTLFGAGLLAATRTRRGRVPQEAIIGIVYAVASAGMVVVMSQVEDVHGAERIKAIMLGRSIVWLQAEDVLHCGLVYLAVGVFHFLFRRQFLAVSIRPEQASKEGLRLAWWDFLFYASFGVVITSSVQIAGVLLVFSFLIVPSVVGALFSRRLGIRLLIGWSFGSLAAFLGLVFSYELPSGPVIVVTFGGLLLAAALISVLRTGGGMLRPALGAGGWLLGGSGLIAVLLLPPWGEILAEQGHLDAAAASPADQAGTDLFASDPVLRERALAALRAHPGGVDVDRLFLAFQKEEDPDLKVHMADEGLRRHDRRFLQGLVQLLPRLESPFFRSEAIHLLERYTNFAARSDGDAADLSRVREWWQRNGRALVWDERSHRFVSR